MSRCFPYPPPDFNGNCTRDVAVIESIKLQREEKKAQTERREEKKVKKERRKEKKREKKEKEKTRRNGEIEHQKKGHKKRLKDDMSQENQKGGNHQNSRKNETDHFEKSTLTEEHGHPIGSENICYSSDGSLNSNKRQKYSSPPNGKHNSGNIFRIRLPLQRHKDLEVLPSKGQPCSALGRTDVFVQEMCDLAPKPGRREGEHLCFASGITGQGLDHKLGRKNPCPSSAAHEIFGQKPEIAPASISSGSDSSLLELRIMDLLDYSVPPLMQSQFPGGGAQTTSFQDLKTTPLRNLPPGTENSRMELVGESEESGGGSGGDGRSVVVVGVKLDQRSKELLTWALVKVAQSGDRVVAVHVLTDAAAVTMTGGKSSLLSLFDTFKTLLAAYEGFCNLKQVELKLKVCRGSSVPKILVREAKSHANVKVIVGISRTNQTIWRSPAWVAKYCARKLSSNFSVFAVDNGKIVFQRRATAKTTDYSRVVALNQDSGSYLQKARSLCGRNTLIRSFLSCSPYSVLPEKDCSQVMEELSDEDESIEDNSFALVPIEPMESVSCSNSVVVDDFPELKPVRLSLRRIFLRNRQSSEKSSLRKMPLSQWVLRLPSCHNSAVVYPDKKHSSSDSDQDEDHSANLDGEKGAILLLGSDVGFTPESPNGSAKSLPKELEGLHEKYSSTCRLFTYQELLLATSNFRPENMVGKGGNSQVYKGCLPDDRELAVKILKQSGDVLKEFVLEIEIITTLHHKNIISLFGFCFEDNNLLLVYDFLSRGSLEENLHGKKKDPMTFGWGERYRVALGVAEALDYLHNGCGQPVIHRDVKSSNILLSDDFEPQLSDFGLAAWANTASHKNCPDVAGTFGYLAPEYFMYGKVNDKIDVYAFGVVLLELLSGRKPISSEYPKGQESLVMWAKPILRSGKISKLLDPDLDSNYDDPQIERMVLAATLCLRRAPRFRPQIGLVLKLLLGDMEIIQWAKQQVSAMEGQEVEGESFPSNIQSHLNLALLDLEDDSLSISSTEQSISLEDYLQGRWSRSSSFA